MTQRGLRPEDLRIDTYTNSGKTQWTRITYLPLGVVMTFTGLRSEDIEAHAIRMMTRYVEQIEILQHGKRTAQSRPPSDAVDGHDPERRDDDPDGEAGGRDV